MNAAVIQVLQQASSQDPNVLKPAEQTLREWETQTGFYTALYNVFSNHSLPVNVRWMALLCFKNGVDKYWRKNAPNGILEEEKKFLRSSLISSFNEPINQLATHLAVVIGKIARLDCPREWDTLIPTLIEVVRGQDSIAQHRALLTLHHVIKMLASKRLLADKQLFEQLTSNIFNFTLNLWNTFTESFLILASNGAEESQIQEGLEKALLLLRILRKLVVNGFTTISKSEDAMLFLRGFFSRAKACLECRRTLLCRNVQPDLIEKLEKFIIHLTKVLLGAQNNHPYCYVDLIPASLEFAVFYCFTEAGQPFVFSKFVIQCLNIIKVILIHQNYRKPWLGQPLDREPASMIAYKMKVDFFTPETLKEIVTWLVTRYFLLTKEDLELWSSDPENFAVDDTRDSWKYSPGPCTETLFLSLMPQNRERIVAILVELVQKHYQPVHPCDTEGILLKDAVYLAVGLAASDLYDEVDFDQWFSTTLKQELEVKHENYKIIKRRVCWLIGKWTDVKLSPELRPELYKMIVKALSPEEDLVVRLEASNTLKRALDDFQFNSDEFAPFIETTFSLLFNLLREANECDTKMQVLYVLSFMIEHIGNDIKPYIGPFSAYLPALWQISEDHNMLRCAIISTLVHYEKALGPESVILEPLIVGMVGLSCDLNQDAHVYLMEDGLELWLALLENAPAPTQGMMDLFRNMPALLDSGLDQVTFKPALYIIEAYLLLSPQDFLGEIGGRVIDGLKSIMADLRADDWKQVMELFEVILQVSPVRGTQVIRPILGRVFRIVYMNEKHDLLVFGALTIIARVLLNSKDIFSEVLTEVARETGPDKTSEMVLDSIIDAFLEKVSWDVRKLEFVKLLALALCSLLSTTSPPVVVQKFPNIITRIVEGLNDIVSINDTKEQPARFIDSLLLANRGPAEQTDRDEGSDRYYFSAETHARKIRLDNEDLVRNVCLRDTFQNQLNILQRCMSKNQFDQMIGSLSPEIDQQLREYVSF